jgi:hypothetical protein
MPELSAGELVYLEVLVTAMARDGLIPSSLVDPFDWEILAHNALDKTYPINSLMVGTLSDLLFLYSPDESAASAV